MTKWVEDPEGGRDRGPRGIARAWVEVLVRPRRFFENAVAPADQAPGLVFAVVVAFVYVSGRFFFAPETIPRFGGSVVLSAAIALAAVCLLVVPLALHMLAALQTIALVPFVRDRAGISETVQVLAYATAPCVFAAVPVPAVRLVAAGYGAVLLVVGLRVRHGTTPLRAALAAVVPATIVFGIAFGGIEAAAIVLDAERGGAFLTGGFRQPF